MPNTAKKASLAWCNLILNDYLRQPIQIVIDSP